MSETAKVREQVMWLIDKYRNVDHPLANKAHKRDYVPADMIEIAEQIKYKLELLLSEEHGPPGGVYDYENRANIEYSFLQVWRKL